MKRIIFISVLILAIVAAAFFGIRSCDNQTEKYHIYAFSGETKFNGNDKKLLNDLFSKDKPEFVFVIHTGANPSGEEIIIKKPKGLTDENHYNRDYTKKIDSLINVLNKHNKINNTTTNILVEQLTNDVSSFAMSDDINKMIILGVFPNTYSPEDLKKLNIEKKITKTDYKNIEILWALKTMADEPEARFKKILTEKGIKVTDKSQISPKRTLKIENLVNAYAILFKKMNLEESKEFEKHLRFRYGNNISLTVWNDGPKNNSIILFTEENKAKDSLLNVFSHLENSNWASIGFLVKQAVNNLQTEKLKPNTPLLFVGNFPPENRGSQLEIKTWETLKSIKNLDVIFYLNNKKKNEIDKAIRSGFKAYKINYQEI